MSYVPDNPPGPPPGPPPGGYGPPPGPPPWSGDPSQPEGFDYIEYARRRVQLPALGLIVVGVLNLLGAIGYGSFGVITTRVPPAELDRQLQEQNPKQYQDMQRAGYTIDNLIKIYWYGGIGSGILAGLLSLLIILGGARMLSGRSWGLSLFASLVAAVPCISPSACCFLGEIVGVWAVIVLLNPHVRAGFR